MFEWQVREEEALPQAEAEAGEPARGGRWRWLLGALLLALLAGAALRWQLREGEQAMRRDLEGFITREERARQFDLQDEVVSLIVPDSAPEWQQRYRLSFQAASGAEPVELGIGAVRFEGETALAELTLDGSTQVRAYQLTSRGWRRRALPPEAWGELQSATLPQGVTLHYRATDAAFARTLLDTLTSVATRSGALAASRDRENDQDGA